MIEIIAAIIGGGLATTLFLKSKKSDTFTIKSDGYKSKPSFTPSKQSVEESNISNAPKSIIDISGINGIRVEGSVVCRINEGTLRVSSDAKVFKKSKTLWVTSKTHKKKGTHIQIYNTQNKLELIPTINGTFTTLNRISLEGSGTLELKNTKLGSELDCILNGSGDILLGNVSTGTLHINLNGSGDIKVKNCKSTQVFANLQGSGDIYLKSDMLGNVSTQVHGSGDIHYNKSNPLIRKFKII